MKPLGISTRFTTKETASFKQYLSDISGIGMFNTKEAEEACSKLAEAGDRKSIDELVKRNLRFVISIAKQYETSTLALEDLVNEGNIGLILAAEKYEPNKGFKFISYAVFWIRKMIFEYIDKNSRIVRLPANKISGLSKLVQEQHKMEQKLGRQVDLYELMEESENLTKEEIQQLMDVSTFSFESLDNPIDGDMCNERHKYIVDESVPPTDYLVEGADLKLRITGLLNRLKGLDRDVIVAVYGLEGTEPVGINEIAERYGINREAVRSIKEKAIRKLKNVCRV